MQSTRLLPAGGFFIAAGLSFFCVSSVKAQVASYATAADLAGGNVTCTFRFGSMVTAPIVLNSDGSVTAEAAWPSGFIFHVGAGDTFVSDWSIESRHTSLDLVGIAIDLTTTKSVFDDNSLPSTDFSASGVAGMSNISGKVPVTDFELNLWTNPINTGDLYTAEKATWGGFSTTGLTYGEVTVWHDDTDLVPEPTSITLAAIGAFALRKRRR